MPDNQDSKCPEGFEICEPYGVVGPWFSDQGVFSITPVYLSDVVLAEQGLVLFFQLNVLIYGG